MHLFGFCTDGFNCSLVDSNDDNNSDKKSSSWTASAGKADDNVPQRNRSAFYFFTQDKAGSVTYFTSKLMKKLEEHNKQLNTTEKKA